MESAPTSPSERAKEDLTIVMINIVVIPIIRKFLPNNFLLDKALPYLIYTCLKIRVNTPVNIKFNINENRGILTLDCAKYSSKV